MCQAQGARHVLESTPVMAMAASNTSFTELRRSMGDKDEFDAIHGKSQGTRWSDFGGGIQGFLSQSPNRLQTAFWS